MKEIRNVELRFHMEKNSAKGPNFDPFSPEAFDFEKNCPIWHFVNEPNREQKPTITINLTCDGTGKVPQDYKRMLGLMQVLMNDLRTAEIEHVVVKLGLGYHANERLALKEEFEDAMGEAIVMDGNEGRHMEFCPREYKEEWEEAQAEERELYPWYDI